MLVKGAPGYKMSLFIGSQPKGFQSNFDRNTCVLCCEGPDVPCHILFQCKDLNLERSVYWENLVNEMLLAMSGEASKNLDLMKSQYLPSGLNNHYIYEWQNMYIPKSAACTKEPALSSVAYLLTKIINNSANLCMGFAKISSENFCTLIACLKMYAGVLELHLLSINAFPTKIEQHSQETYLQMGCMQGNICIYIYIYIFILHILMPPTMITKHGMLQ